MRISTIVYAFKQGFKNIWNNLMFSVASIATMSACIFLFGLFFSIVVNFQYIVRNAESNVTMTVFFDEGLDGSMRSVRRLMPAMRLCRSIIFLHRRHGIPSVMNILMAQMLLQRAFREITRCQNCPAMRFMWIRSKIRMS